MLQILLLLSHSFFVLIMEMAQLIFETCIKEYLCDALLHYMLHTMTLNKLIAQPKDRVLFNFHFLL